MPIPKPQKQLLRDVCLACLCTELLSPALRLPAGQLFVSNWYYWYYCANCVLLAIMMTTYNDV